MRIIIDARELRTSSGRYVERLLHYLQQLDNENTYKVLLYPKDIDGWKPSNRRFTKVACPYKEFTFAEQIGLLRQLNKLGGDLVHFDMAQQPLLYRGKVVTTINDLTTVRFRNPSKNWLVFTIKQWVYKWVIKIATRKSKEVLTFTEFVKDDVAKFTRTNSRKITAIHLGADKIEEPPKPIEQLVGKQFIMYVGRPLPHKNLPRLIDAFEQLRQENPGLWLVLAGKRDNLYKEIEKSVRRRGLKHVLFAGFVEEGELRWLYENCAAYVFPSLSEGFGLPGLEAMVQGAPVVSSNATCLPEVFDKAAAYFDPYDINDMSEQIAKVIGSEKLRQQMIQDGRHRAAKFSWRKTAEQTLAIYKEVLKD